MGSGNHFVELQRVERIVDADVARAFGLREGQLTVLIHSGSRGLGQPGVQRYVREMEGALRRYDNPPARPPARLRALASPEGERYLAAMRAAANYARANRAAIAHRIRESIAHVLGPQAAAGTRQVYDVAHNVAKMEHHGGRELCVHRKGATRAFPAGAPDLPDAYPRCRPAGVHSREHGDQQLRPRRAARLDGAVLR